MKGLIDFVNKWERKHRRFNFIIRGYKNRLSGVDIRYAPTKYRESLTHENWEKLIKEVETKSRNTMFVSTNEKLFTRGIINVEVASRSNYYRESTVISVLEWVAEDFFPPVRN